MSSDYFTENIERASVTVEMPDGVERMIENIQTELIPTIEVIIGDVLDEIIEDAKKNWLVRAKKSRNSKDKFEKEVFVSDNGQKVKGVIRNNAAYAYAIRSGRRSKTS